MNRNEQRGFDLHEIVKYPWESPREWDGRISEEIDRRRRGERLEFPSAL